ncbi:hypothetical protein AOD74_0202895 [Helicobacter pylori]|nr:hypothetical protein AOD74_0202895 [Helicobacter pylori]OKB27658.1 hypothetical protein AOD76_0202675 [Helicobacter pylori]
MFLKSVGIFKLFLLHYGYFWLCYTKTFIFKNGLLVAFCDNLIAHVIPFKKYFKFFLHKLFYY